MSARNKLTNNSEETDLSEFISGDVVFSIPFFQRSYRWKPARLKQLNEDILRIVDEESGMHFLGAVIIHGRSSNPSDPRVYEVIDGQQRITTIFLYIAAAVKTIAEYGDLSEAASMFLKYLIIPRDTRLSSNLKLHPCKQDRAQYNRVISDLLDVEGLKRTTGADRSKRLQSTGKEDGVLWQNYKRALRFFKEQYESEGLERVQDVYQKMLQSMSLVQIDVWDPTSGPKIFDSLNSRQEPMTVGDLVRNEIFSRIAEERPDNIEQVDQQHWQPFYTRFQAGGRNLFDSYFFPYGLIGDPNLRKSEVYNALRDSWHDIGDPRVIIRKLSQYQDAFLDLVAGGNAQGLSVGVAAALNSLWRSGLPASTYPFLMRLSYEAKNGSVLETDVVDALNVVESFLVRRAVCGHEPTGLHAVFKRLWVDCDGGPAGSTVTAAIARHRTVVWPDDCAFKDAVWSRPLYGAGITRYLLREYDRSLGGDEPDAIPWIEHVLPETPDPEWFASFSKEQHRETKDLVGNLIPLSRRMNQELSNRPYLEKREVYRADSMFKSARQFAERYAKWSPSGIEERCSMLADWMVRRWPVTSKGAP